MIFQSFLPLATQAGPPAPAVHKPWGPEVKRILCVRLDNLGDVLMTTPAFHALRSAAPGRHLALFTSSAGAKAADFIPDIDQVICYDAPWIENDRSHLPANERQIMRVLEEGCFDAAVIFTVYSQNPLPAALICYFAGIPRRLAYCREDPSALLTDWVAESEPHKAIRHEVERQLALVNQIGACATDRQMRFAVPDADRQSLMVKLGAHGVNPHAPYSVLHPGASAASRRYPAERFGEAAAQLVHKVCHPVLITGSLAERQGVETVIRSAGAAARAYLRSLAGVLSLGELAALIERAAVLISNNSGPVHLACALRTPVVDLYALTNPQHTPWQTPHRVLFREVACHWCYRSICPFGQPTCLTGVTPAEVAQAALEIMAPPRKPVLNENRP